MVKEINTQAKECARFSQKPQLETMLATTSSMKKTAASLEENAVPFTEQARPKSEKNLKGTRTEKDQANSEYYGLLNSKCFSPTLMSRESKLKAWIHGAAHHKSSVSRHYGMSSSNSN